MGERESKRKPPPPPPAATTDSKPRESTSEDAKTAVYKPIPLEADADAEPALEPRKRGSTLSGIPGRKDDEGVEPPAQPDPKPASKFKSTITDPRGIPIPPPSRLFTDVPSLSLGAPRAVKLAKTAGPFKVPPPVPPAAPSDGDGPKVVKLEKTAGPWKVPPLPPPVPAAVPPPPKGSAREPGPPVPAHDGAHATGPGETSADTSGDASAGPVEGTTTTGLVAALTDEIVAAQEAEEAEALAAELALESSDDAAGESAAASGVRTLVGRVRSGQLDAFSVRLLAAGWFVAGAAVVGLIWALWGGSEPLPQPRAQVVAPPAQPSVVTAPVPVLVAGKGTAPQPPVPVPEDALADEDAIADGETGETADEGDLEDPDGAGEGSTEDAAEPAAPAESRTRKRSRPKQKPKPEPAPEPKPAPKPVAKPAPKPEPAKTAAQLLSEAKAAYKRGDAAKAHDLAKASRTKSKTTAATELMVLASCKRKQATTAERELKLLPLLKRGNVKRDCKAMGVKL